jgi:hypothetical protein
VLENVGSTAVGIGTTVGKQAIGSVTFVTKGAIKGVF